MRFLLPLLLALFLAGCNENNLRMFLVPWQDHSMQFKSGVDYPRGANPNTQTSSGKL